MRIVDSYSHLNGEEYLMVWHKELYREIKAVIKAVDADSLKTKISKEARKEGRSLYAPKLLNKAFDREFTKRDWHESRYSYYITLDRQLMQQTIPMPAKEQKAFLMEQGVKEPIHSYNQTDYVKDKIAVEVQFGKYAFVAYDLFVKHMLFYSGGVINLGIEIVPTKKMTTQMSSGIAYYEGEVYNVMRQGRHNPPVPLLIIGVEP